MNEYLKVDEEKLMREFIKAIDKQKEYDVFKTAMLPDEDDMPENWTVRHLEPDHVEYSEPPRNLSIEESLEIWNNGEGLKYLFTEEQK